MKNKTKIITTMFLLMFLPMVMALSPAPNGECYVHEPVLLENTGFNSISVITNYSDLAERTITLELNDFTLNGGTLNLLGNSFMDKVSLNTLIFTNSTGDTKNYQDAISDGWIEPINKTDINTGTESNEPYFNNFVTYEGYWLTSYHAVNISYTAFAEPIGNTFSWFDLRFSNGTDEKNITEAGDADWITTSFKYWGLLFSSYTFKFISNRDTLTIKSFLNSSEGVLVDTRIDNIYLITNNETTPCRIKVKCSGKFIGNTKVCKPKVKAKYIGSNGIFRPKFHTNHDIRLLGARRTTIG